jgi:hypothetical protein
VVGRLLPRLALILFVRSGVVAASDKPKLLKIAEKAHQSRNGNPNPIAVAAGLPEKSCSILYSANSKTRLDFSLHAAFPGCPAYAIDEMWINPCSNFGHLGSGLVPSHRTDIVPCSEIIESRSGVPFLSAEVAGWLRTCSMTYFPCYLSCYFPAYSLLRFQAERHLLSVLITFISLYTLSAAQLSL